LCYNELIFIGVLDGKLRTLLYLFFIILFTMFQSIAVFVFIVFIVSRRKICLLYTKNTPIILAVWGIAL